MPSSGLQDKFTAILADPTLRERLLPAMTPQEAALVERVLDPLVAETYTWCRAHFSVTKPHAFTVPSALQMILQFPRLPPDRLGTVVQFIHWIFALDDMLDDTSRPFSELSALADECFLVLALDASTSRSESAHAGALRDIVAKMRQWKLFPTFSGVWVVGCVRLIDGLVFGRCRFVARKLDEYLFFTGQAVGMPIVSLTGLIATDDPGVSRSPHRLVALLGHLGAMVRMANDARGYDADVSEGCPNAVAIARDSDDMVDISGGNVRSAAARDYIMKEIARERDCALMLASQLGEDAHLGLEMVRGVDFAVDLYRRGNFRTWPLASS